MAVRIPVVVRGRCRRRRRCNVAIAWRRPEQRPVPHRLPDDPAAFQGLGIHPEPFNDQDAIVIRRQMGHRPQLALAVARRCRYGYPQVLIFAPLLVAQDHVSPNSTLCWLSCPLLVREMDKLEKQGEIERFEHLISADEGLRSAIEDAHRATARIRQALIPKEWLERLQAQRPRDFWIVASTGISGITRPDHVKCLHAHLADYLARGANPVGEEVARLLESQGTSVDGTETCWRFCTPEGASERITVQAGDESERPGASASGSRGSLPGARNGSEDVE